MFVGGDPEDEQFNVKVVAELSSRDEIITGAAKTILKIQLKYFRQFDMPG